MTDAFDAARYGPLAAAVGLELPAAGLWAVIGAFAVLARVAGPVMAFPLAEDVIAAGVFTPGDGFALGDASALDRQP